MAGSSLDYDLALSIAPYLGISRNKAGEITDHIKGVVSQWRKVATSYGIPNSDQDVNEGAFNHQSSPAQMLGL